MAVVTREICKNTGCALLAPGASLPYPIWMVLDWSAALCLMAIGFLYQLPPGHCLLTFMGASFGGPRFLIGKHSLGPVIGGRRAHYYRAFSFREFPWCARHRRDIIVAETAGGKASAFLRARSAFTDYLSNPSGQFIETTENPAHWFREHAGGFWAVYWFLFCWRADPDQPRAVVSCSFLSSFLRFD